MFNIGTLVAVALLWGITNPLLRRTSSGIENIREKTILKQKIAEFIFLASRWQYLTTFALNQLGSILFFSTLQRQDLSLVVPVTNSLAFVFTAIMAHMLGEKHPSWKSYFGLSLILVGTGICMYEKESVYNI